MHQSSRIRLECREMPEKVKKFPRAIQVMPTQYSLGVQRSEKKTYHQLIGQLKTHEFWIGVFIITYSYPIKSIKMVHLPWWESPYLSHELLDLSIQFFQFCQLAPGPNTSASPIPGGAAPPPPLPANYAWTWHQRRGLRGLGPEDRKKQQKGSFFLISVRETVRILWKKWWSLKLNN